MRNKMELLAPAGDTERLRAAVCYGADAVYMAGRNLGLRANAKNFDAEELAEGVSYAHKHGVKVYITANIFAHNEDFEGMGEYFKNLESLGVDALIISDPGVFSVAREVVPGMDIHISTQANITNCLSARFWLKAGASRLILARELSLAEIKDISREIPETELECFVHGAMCVSYSGRCLLSNYMTGRDGNRGDCAQPCRWKYALMEEKRPGEYIPVEEDARGTYIFNSRDLCMIGHIDKLDDAGISSLKIEGRMKTAFYVATVVKAYREAIEDYFKDPLLYSSKQEHYLSEIKKASYRDFTTGFYFGKTDSSAQNYSASVYVRDYSFIAVVINYDPKTGVALIEQRNNFSVGDVAEVLQPGESGFSQKITHLENEVGEPVLTAPHPRQLLKLKTDKPVAPMDMLRKRVN